MVLNMLKSLFPLVFLIFGLNATTQEKNYHLPIFINPCNKSEPDLNACIRNAVELIRPKLPDGIPEMLIPRFEPLHLPRAVLTDNALEAKFDDIKISHLSKTEILDLNFDTEKPELVLNLHIPELSMESRYEVEGKLLVFNLNGKGTSSGNYSNIYTKIILSGNIILKNGTKYFNFDRAKVKLEIEWAEVFVEGLIKDPDMNDALIKIINGNILLLLKEMMPIIEVTIENFVLQMAKKFFEAFSVDALFVE